MPVVLLEWYSIPKDSTQRLQERNPYSKTEPRYAEVASNKPSIRMRDSKPAHTKATPPLNDQESFEDKCSVLRSGLFPPSAPSGSTPELQQSAAGRSGVTGWEI